MKKNNFKTNKEIDIPIRILKDLYLWQKKAEDILLNERSRRAVHWIYDPNGCNGKTAFLKYMHIKHKAIFTDGGKKTDVMNLMYKNKKYLECIYPAIIIWNLPRDIDKKYISYHAMESIKDGIICNNKYKCGSLIINPPNLMIMCNQLHDFKKLPSDRWNIWTIKENELIKYEDP